MFEQFQQNRWGRPHNHECHQGEERHRGRFRGFDAPFRDRGFGGGRERHFDNGELRFVILQLVAEKPSYGYEIIKAIEERLAGGYTPSPGVVYPTLTMLEDEGYATVTSTEANKKLYTVTVAGQQYLEEHKAVVQAIFERMENAGKAFGRGRVPQIMRAMMNLGYALKMRTERGNLSADQISKIVETIDAAARAIDEV
jgi:DNA-binding PadR family transcriptional regulator